MIASFIAGGVGKVMASCRFKASSNDSITPPAIPKALVVLSITVKVLFNCLTNLFFLLIIEINSNWEGQEDLLFIVSKTLSWVLAIKSEALVTPNPAIKVNTVGISVDFKVLIWLDKRSWT